MYTTDELAKAPEDKRLRMLALTDEYNITILESLPEDVRLVQAYLEHGVIPPSSVVDAAHIAIASVYDMDMILSLNFTHIVRKRTIELAALVNSNCGYRKIEIFSPMEVVKRDQT